jgi:membrane fusion protein, multidrug efflux system
MKYAKQILVIATAVAATACGNNAGNKDVAAKQKELAQLKTEQTKIADNIAKLEAEIVKLDPSLARVEKPKLVSTVTIQPRNFEHFIDLEGRIISDNIAYVSPRGGGGQVKEIFVKRGDYVKRGTLVLRLDDAIAKKQLDAANTQLNLAKDILRRRENLWKDNIGTEVELVSARNNVEQVERQIALVKEQISFANVYSNMDGVVEDVTIRVGELFSGSPLGGYVKLVNTNDLKVQANVPENYLNKVGVGTNMKVAIPEINAEETVKIFNTGKIIDANTRSFYVEAKLPGNKLFRPNQIAIVHIKDYAVNNAIVVPVNTLQTDEKGKFVMVAETRNGKLYAKKKVVIPGEIYGDNLEIKTGLAAGDVLISEGYQSIYDGQLIVSDK